MKQINRLDWVVIILLVLLLYLASSCSKVLYDGKSTSGPVHPDIPWVCPNHQTQYDFRNDRDYIKWYKEQPTYWWFTPAAHPTDKK